LDYSQIIEPIAKLNRETLAELIRRMETPRLRPVCFTCWDPEAVLTPYGGQLLCEPCILIERGRGGLARWNATQVLFAADLKRGKRK
jgi:ABC-type proline/glycine betaine transport system substrate-binding protein